MKILLTLFLFFILSGCERNYIKDYKIEGIGLGDSLLDHFTRELILKNQNNYYNDNEYKESTFLINNISSEYDDISARYKNNDDKFILSSIEGGIYYGKNLDECYSKKDEIIKNLSNLLKDIKWKDTEFEDEEGVYTNTIAELKSGEYIVVACYDWNYKTENEKNWIDHLRVSIDSKEFSYWINNIEN